MRRPLAIAGLIVALTAGCRAYHEPLPFDECQPYPLECPVCTFEDELVADGVLRAWRCTDPEFGVLDAVATLPLGIDAVDTRYYDPETGYRIAAVREFDAPRDVCGQELEAEWYGQIVTDCQDVCEHDSSLPEAHPGNPSCSGIQ